MSVSAAAALVMKCCAIAAPLQGRKPAFFAMWHLFQMFLWTHVGMEP